MPPPQIHAASGENLERNIANDSTENSHEQVESRDADSCFSIERGRRYDRRSIPRCGEFLPQPFGSSYCPEALRKSYRLETPLP